MFKGLASGDKHDCFAPPPRTTEWDEWRALDNLLPADYLARRIARAVERLDSDPL